MTYVYCFECPFHIISKQAHNLILKKLISCEIKKKKNLKCHSIENTKKFFILSMPPKVFYMLIFSWKRQWNKNKIQKVVQIKICCETLGFITFGLSDLPIVFYGMNFISHKTFCTLECSWWLNSFLILHQTSYSWM